MKKIFVYTTLFLFLLVSFSLADTIVVNTENAPLQLSYDNPQVINLIPKGEQLETTGKEGKFFAVEYKGLKGYICKQFTLQGSYDPEDTDFTPTMTKQTSADGLHYWLYKPGETDGCQRPLIVFLHASGESGKGLEGLDKLLSNNSLPKFLYQGQLKVNAVVVMPQVAGVHFTAVEGAVVNLISEMEEKENIDPKKVILTGHSLGAMGTYDIGNNHPDLFAALVPVAGYPTVKYDPANYAKTVLSAYVNCADGREGITANIVNEVNAAGGKAEYEVYNVSHGSIPAKVYTTETLKWMMTQERN